MAIALVVASLIWGIRIGERELWHDEVYTLLEARGIGYGAEGPQQGFTANELDQFNSFPRVLRACVFMDSGNGTAYVSMIHIWSALFGTSPVALRSWSMVLALLSVFMLYRLGNLLFPGRWVAACAALLLACSPLLFTMAIDARSYMQALFLTILATLLLFRLMKEERPGRGLVFLYGTVAGLALLSHYSSCYIIAAHPLVALQQRTPWGRIARILPAGAVAVGMVLTWLFNGGFAGLEQMSIYNQYYVDQLKELPDLISFYSATSPRSLVEGWGVQLLWASGNGLQFAGPRLRSVLLLLVIPVALVLLVLRTASAQKDKRTMGSLLILAVSSMLYATALALTSGHTVSFQAKYVVFSLPYLALAMAWAAEIAFRERGPSLQVARAAAMLGVVIVAASLVLAMNAPSPIGPDRYQEYNTSIVKELEQAPDAEVVLVHSSWTAAYLCAIYSEGSARSLKHFVKPDLNAITGLFVNGHADEGFEVIRAQDPRFSRSQPHDDPTWQLNNDSLPNLPAFAPVQGTTH
ncbi:MAG: glycosyltransferase family 39 protein [Flavobacteriales bacterium]|nr:glycosyltransferase family 39 protein [Flavobacteriales bacterium]